MKATGIVRRVDELGRVVIPKEIRRTLRIKEGDPLEIFTERDELTFKKYSPIATIEQFSESAARSLQQISGKTCLVCDTDGVLHVFGDGRKEFLGKSVSKEMENVMYARKSYAASRAEGGEIVPITLAGEEKISAEIIVPVVSSGDCLGAVALLMREDGAKIDKTTLDLVRLTADILANQF